jgi:hypothetical protein
MRLHSLTDGAVAFSVANARQFVPGEGFSKDVHKRAVS